MSRSIALVGLPGGGKSTIGRQLARRLKRRFVDTDSLIEQRIGCPIRSYFEQEGEPAFREVEEQVIASCCSSSDEVIATGGGAILREANRRALHQNCYVVYLRSTPDEVFRRLRHDTQRPLLQVPDPLARLRQLFTDRDPLYRDVAHFVLDTGRPSVSSLVSMLIMQLELSGALPAPGASAEG